MNEPIRITPISDEEAALWRLAHEVNAENGIIALAILAEANLTK